MERDAPGLTIRLVQGDICDRPVGAIVNAANNHLWMGGGVAGAIKRRGGPEIEHEAMRQGPIAVGEAVATGAGRLPACYVIHAAVMGQDLVTNADLIRRATTRALVLAEELGVTTIAFPALGTGVGGFAMKECARVMLAAVASHAATHRLPPTHSPSPRCLDLSAGRVAERGPGGEGPSRLLDSSTPRLCVVEFVLFDHTSYDAFAAVLRESEASDGGGN